MAFVFIDRILECEAGERVVALKALAFNEEFFRDHFPGMPVLPGAMILEGFVQAARRCLAAKPGGDDLWVLAEVAQMRFNRFVVPGEVVRLEVEREKEEEGAVWFRGRAYTGEEGVGRLRFSVRPRAAAEVDEGTARA
ncbi:MAG: 3-hydroxyacyl-[acyl-carrier-protein] dehydratase FabZ [Planctomycetes bacterium]|nr:3-hydroxyacyl-[acyl-carrier-protein] dehydratase FabZ [Planctomycetota bacterium]